MQSIRFQLVWTIVVLASAIAGCGAQDKSDASVAREPEPVAAPQAPVSTELTGQGAVLAGQEIDTVDVPPDSGPLTDEQAELVVAADQALMNRDLDQMEVEVDKLALQRPTSAVVAERKAALEVYREQLETAQPWDGPVPHLFYHTLIVDPTLAFDGDYTDAGYRLYMVTATEFDRILEQMYANKYILVDVHDLYDEAPDGTITKTLPMVPAGYKPFIMSIDDVSYYDYMAGDGFADRLEVDENLNVATRVITAEGSELTYTGDVSPVLDRFVAAHPDFSYLGAKGIIALTGYEGALGYDVSADQVDAPDYAERVEQATAVADRMKQMGWKFASHSYSHSQKFKNDTITVEGQARDINAWLDEVGPIVGPTDLYISPFGYYMKNDDPRYRYLIEEAGFNFFAAIWDGTTFFWNSDNVVDHRIAVDGYTLENRNDDLAPYFDAATVWDTARGPWPGGVEASG